MQYLRLASDIHLDFDVLKFKGTRSVDLSDPVHVQREELIRREGDLAFLWFPDELPEDPDTCLVIAGDLWVHGKFLDRKFSDGESWMGKLSKRFKYVVFVLGNHDYWGTNLSTEPEKVRAQLVEQKLDNVHLLEKNTVTLDGVKFIGGTLWTDYNRHDPLVMLHATQFMNDYSRIRFGSNYRKVRPTDLYDVHKTTASYLFENARRDHPDQVVVVVTHMLPSLDSINEVYKQYVHNMMSNYLYFSDLDQRIASEGQDISFWFHGHTHHSSDYLLGSCRVVCQPRGYSGHEQTDWNPTWRVRA